MSNTKLGGGWCGGWRKDNGKVKDGKRILPNVSFVRVAVSGLTAHNFGTDAYLKFTGKLSWTLREHLDAVKKDHLLTLLFEPPGDVTGHGFKRGVMWEPTFEELKETLVKLLVPQVKYLELGNEFGIIAQGAERIRRWTYLADMAVRVEEWLTEEYPDVQLIMGGLYGIEEWLHDGEYVASWNAFIIHNYQRLAGKVWLSLHTFPYTVAEIEDSILEIRENGFEVALTEEFDSDTTFGRLEVVQLAYDMEVPLVNVFLSFFSPTWGHERYQDTSLLAVTGPNGNVRDGKNDGEPDYLSVLEEMARAVSDTGETDPSFDARLTVVMDTLRALADEVEDIRDGRDPDEQDDGDPDENESGVQTEEEAFLDLMYDPIAAPTQIWRPHARFGTRFVVVGKKTRTEAGLNTPNGVVRSTVGYGESLGEALLDYEKNTDSMLISAMPAKATGEELELLSWFTSLDASQGSTSLRRATNGKYYGEYYRPIPGPRHGPAWNTPTGALRWLKGELG